MPFTLTMPKLSPTMDEGTIAKWHKKVGDFVEPGDVLIEVATDKATVEHAALDEGYLRKILVGEGDEARVNQAIAIFTEDKSESIDDYQPEGVQPDQAVEVEEQTKPSTAQASSGSEAHTTAQAMALPAFAPEPPLEDYEYQPQTSGKLLASPLAKRLAKEKGLDLASVKGSGPRGRIVSKDLEYAAPEAMVSFGKESPPPVAPGSFTEEKLSPMRKAVGSRLQQAKASIPHFYVTQEIDAAALVSIRDQLKAVGVKATFNDFVVRASALALRDHPVINSGFNSRDGSIIRFQTIDVSVAVTVDGGLITPIVRHADYKNIGEISTEIRELATLARKGKLSEEQYKGGSFTVSNLGMYGVADFVAVINPPQAAILAVGGILDVPMIKDGAVVPGKMMRVTLSSDHRVIDGSAAAEFLLTVKRLLENPAALLV